MTQAHAGRGRGAWARRYLGLFRVTVCSLAPLLYKAAASVCTAALLCDTTWVHMQSWTQDAPRRHHSWSQCPVCPAPCMKASNREIDHSIAHDYESVARQAVHRQRVVYPCLIMAQVASNPVPSYCCLIRAPHGSHDWSGGEIDSSIWELELTHQLPHKNVM